MATRARREVAKTLPPGWFKVRHLHESTGGVAQDHIELEAMAGPPVGFFQLWRSANLFEVHHFPAGGRADGVSVVGAYPDIRGAVGAVVRVIDATLTGWGLPPLALRVA